MFLTRTAASLSAATTGQLQCLHDRWRCQLSRTHTFHCQDSCTVTVLLPSAYLVTLPHLTFTLYNFIDLSFTKEVMDKVTLLRAKVDRLLEPLGPSSLDSQLQRAARPLLKLDKIKTHQRSPSTISNTNSDSFIDIPSSRLRQRYPERHDKDGYCLAFTTHRGVQNNSQTSMMAWDLPKGTGRARCFFTFLCKFASSFLISGNYGRK
ncbi:uncharacterized protein BJ212DRAFT_1304767 [Suillus subaureus]|uniref:Uncharacterized protein n=1 Tax=Suillus subaureus TaxID=48587 RepID=A0A9P7J4Y5_9AGAM|nr:uncharacterized protein BJ212DRAFT_1304767 [Suillus subaureus]KAG1802984.1 hypothetical protein BJ212DRAFT_1304767 [Suillus subaureus]